MIVSMRISIGVLFILLAASLTAQEVGDDEINDAVSKLGSDYELEREAGYQVLLKAGKKAEKAVMMLLDASDTQILKYVLMLLTKYETREAEPVKKVGGIFEQSKDEEINTLCVEFFKGIPKESEKFLLAALDSKPESIKQKAFEILKDARLPSAFDKAFDIIKNGPDTPLGDAALKYVLGNVDGNEMKVATLLIVQNKKVREETLKKLSCSKIPELKPKVLGLLKDETDAPVVAAAFESMENCATVEDYASLLGTASEVRKKAAGALADRSAEAAFPKVEERFQKEDQPDVQLEMVRYFASVPQKSAAVLNKLMKDGSSHTARLIEWLSEKKGEKKKLPKELADGLLFAFIKAKELRPTILKGLAICGDTPEDTLLDLIRRRTEFGKYEEWLTDAIQQLSFTKSPKAIPDLVDLMNQPDEKIAEESRRALARIGEAAIQYIEKAQNPLPAAVVDQVKTMFIQIKIEDEMKNIFTRNVYGYYAGLFDPMKRLSAERKIIVGSLIQIIKGKVLSDEFQNDNSGRVKDTAILALSEFPDETGIELLKSILNDVYANDNTRSACLFALNKCGQGEFATSFVQKKVEEGVARGDSQGWESVAFYAKYYSRTGQYKKALDLYAAFEGAGEDKLKDITGLPVIYYNISCTNSLAGNKEEALKYLEKAIAKGWGEPEWMQKDNDLSALRQTEEFKKLVERAKLNQR